MIYYYLLAFLPTITIAVFNVILYWPTIKFGTCMDDTQHYENITRAGGIYDPTYPIYTELRDRLYGAGTFGINTRLDHKLTILLWTILCMLIYEAFGHNNISWAAAMLVSCHPVMNQLSIWLNGRRYLVCAILLMLCMISWPWGSLFFYALSAGLQVTIFMAPVLFINKFPFAWLAVLNIGILIFIRRKWIMKKIERRAEQIYSKDIKEWQPRRPVVVIKVFGWYFFKMIIPQRVQTVYPFLQMFGRTQKGSEEAYAIFNKQGICGVDQDFIKGCVALCIVVVMFAFSPSCYRPYVLFLFMSLLQWCAIIPITQFVADRYAGVPCIFMCFFIAYFSLTYLPLAGAIGLMALLAGGYIYVTRQVFFMYRHFVAWYDYHVYDDFSNLAVIVLKIGLLLSEKKLCQAGALLEHALSYYPNDYALNYLGYIISMITQNLPLARKHLDTCVDNVYLGEESIRKGELADADLGIRALSGEKNLVIPSHMMGPNMKGKK